MAYIKGNPYGRGNPVSQESLEPLFRELKEKRANQMRRRAKAFAKLQRGRCDPSRIVTAATKYLGFEKERLKDFFAATARPRKPNFNFSSSKVIKPVSFTPFRSSRKNLSWKGSGGAVRYAPFDYSWGIDSISENAPSGRYSNQKANGQVDPGAIANASIGYVEFGGFGSWYSTSSIFSNRMVGIYVSPPNAGLLSFSATAVIQGWSASECIMPWFGSNSSVGSLIVPEIWEIENGSSLSSPMLGIVPMGGFGVSFQDGGNCFNSVHSEVTGSQGWSDSDFTQSFGYWTQNSGGPLSPTPEPQVCSMAATAVVDTDHYYILWVSGYSAVSSTGYYWNEGLNQEVGIVAGAVYGAIILDMSWSLTP